MPYMMQLGCQPCKLLLSRLANINFILVHQTTILPTHVNVTGDTVHFFSSGNMVDNQAVLCMAPINLTLHVEIQKLKPL